MTSASLKSFLARLLAVVLWGVLSDGPCLQAGLVGRYLVDGWQGERGLPQSIVTGLAQTPDGYLWVSTLDGLARFDGVRFKMFKAGNAPVLGSGRIRFLLAGQAGELWICTQEGRVIRFRNGEFEPLPLPKAVRTRSGTVQVATDEGGGVWLSAEDGVVGRLLGEEWSVVSTNWESAGRSSFQVRPDAGGQPWAICRTGLYRVAGTQLEPALEGKPGEFQVLCPGRRGGWWVGRSDQIGLWCEGQWRMTLPAPPSNTAPFRCSLEDRSGQLWLGSTTQGLLCCSRAGEWSQFTRREGLGSDAIRCLWEDSEGHLWVGTEGGGLNRLRRALFTVCGPERGIPLEHLTSVSAGPDGELWLGTDGASLRLIPADQPRTASPGLLEGPLHAMAVLADSRGRVWAGSRAGGVFCADGGPMRRLTNGVVSGLTVRCLFEDSQGAVWVGWRNSATVARIQGGSVTTIALPPSVRQADIRVITEDGAGNIWLGTDGNGLLRWHEGRFTHYTRDQGLGSDFIWSLHPEPDGALWIGTYGHGLTRLKAGRAVSCTTSDGLVDDVIGSIIDDGRGQYWFGSNQGIFRAGKAELTEFAEGRRRSVTCVAYGRADGLPALQCWGGYQPVATHTPDGRLWFITVRGLVAVDPAEVDHATPAPKVCMEELLVDGRVVDCARVPREIPPGGKLFEFQYTALSFGAPEALRFRHKLEGIDADWVEPGARRSASYIGLPAGSYTFRVQALNREGIWSQPGAALTFTVRPYFWQTGWFIGIFLVTFGGTVAWLVGLTLKRRHQRHLRLVQRLHLLERERVRVARDIHDDLGSSLTEIGYLGALAVRDAQTVDEAREQMARILERTRALAGKLDETVWAVNPKNDSLAHLATYLGQFTREFLGSMDLRCRVDLSTDLPAVELTAEVRHHVFLAAKEALNNAARHACASEVRLRLMVRQGELTIEVSDDGCGFEMVARCEAGNGLRNMAARMEEIGGRWEITSSTPGGTTVTLRLPLPPERAAGRLGAAPSQLGDAAPVKSD